MTYSELVDRLRARPAMPLFATAPWDEGLQAAIRAATPETLFPGQPIVDPPAAIAVIAGLRLWNDDFAGAHNLAQGLENPTGSYWHGLCHRREGHEGAGLASNLGNSRHWFRRVGRHPAFDPAYRMALDVLGGAGFGFRWATEATSLLEQRGEWDPFLMIDWVEAVERGTLSHPTRALLEEIQWREIDLLTDWCAARALGTPA
jgi:hypothetical protein